MEEKEYNFESFTIGGAIFQTLLTNKYKNRAPYTIPNKKQIFSFIPGTISKVNIKEGSKVKEGEELLILDAMKMHNSIKAPFNGVIAKVTIKVGEMVKKNQLLVEFK